MPSLPSALSFLASALTAMVADGLVPVPIDRVYPFEQLPQAMSRLEAGEQMGKIGVAL